MARYSFASDGPKLKLLSRLVIALLFEHFSTGLVKRFGGSSTMLDGII